MRKIVIDTNAMLQMLGSRSPYHFLWKKFLDEEYVLCVLFVAKLWVVKKITTI